MKTILPALLALLTLTASAAPDWKPGAEFLAALGEKDPLKRTEMLLTAAESGVYPADLALIHLTRAELEPRHGERLRKIAGNRRGELIPAVLVCRNAEPPDAELFELALAAWRKNSDRKLSAFEAPLFRELSASLVSLGCGLGEYAALRPPIENLIRGDAEWRSKLPVSALAEFYVSCAFATEGFELPEASWAQSPSEVRQACIRLLDELPKLQPDAEESSRLIHFFLRIGARPQALAVALAYANRNPDKSLPILVTTAVETGEVKIVDSLKRFIKPQLFGDFLVRALGNDCAFAEAFKALDRIADPARRRTLYLELVNRQGDLKTMAKLARDPKSDLTPAMRILWLLDAAEKLNDRGYFDDAEKFVTPKLDEDPMLANALGYVALELGIGPERAEARIDRALKSDPRNSAYLDSKAYARYTARDYDGAWEWMQKALKTIEPSPAVAEILEHAGDIRLALGDRTRAREFYRATLKLLDGVGKRPKVDEFQRFRKRVAGKLEKLK